MILNFHKKPQRDFVFHFFFNFYYSLFILFCLLFIFFSSARRCARNCVLAYRELRACHDNDNLDETLILDDSDFFYSEIDKIDFIENHFDLEPIADVFFTFKECA